MTANSPEFKRIQQDFANHIKSPDQVARLDDVDDRHMAIYRDLFFKNIMGFLSGGFPVLADIMGGQRWQVIGREFFSKHVNKSPFFLEISREFLTFLEQEYVLKEGDPLYLYELAHYEWLELYVDVELEVEGYKVDLDSITDILSSMPVLSPVVEGFLYNYPVHQISSENPLPEPMQTALIVYRKADDSVAFLESNPFTLQLLSLLKEQNHTGEALINTLLKQYALEGSEAAYQGGIDTLKQWLELELIIGSKS